MIETAIDSGVGVCDSCGKTGYVRVYSDKETYSGIGLCDTCYPEKLKIVLICSNSRASNAAIGQFISRYKSKIALVVVTSQLKGNILKRVFAALKYYKRVDKDFFWYKVKDCLLSDSVVDIAHRHGIRTLRTNDVNDYKVITRIRFTSPSFIVSVFANQKFTRPLISCAVHGALNVHGSLLPHYRGSAQYYWYLKNHDKTGGVTIHLMDDELDTGDIVWQRSFAIKADDTMCSLHKRIADYGVGLLDTVFDDFIKHKQLNRYCQPETDEQPLKLPTQS